MSMKTFTIGQLAKQAKVNIETIRYYERRGLLPEPQRRASGYREYSTDDVIRLRFIKRAQELGFTLKEIAELLGLRVESRATCRKVKNQAEIKIAVIDERIRVLKAIKTALNKLVASCDEQTSNTRCSILEYLIEK